MNQRSLTPQRSLAPSTYGAITTTIAQALATTHSHTASDDLLFLEAWEYSTNPGLADMLRAAQIRRANPALAAALRAEIQSTRLRSQPEHPHLSRLAAI